MLASRALELNGLTPTSDGGEDAGSLGGSESDTSRTDGRHHTRTGSVKKPTSFKPVSFAKFSVPKAPGSISTSKVGDKGSLFHSITFESSSNIVQYLHYQPLRAPLLNQAQGHVWWQSLRVSYEIQDPNLWLVEQRTVEPARIQFKFGTRIDVSVI